ncbi:aconitate hydratase [bacterium]|nr:aconitate hydratase [bacterium]
MNLTQKILAAHLVSGTPRPGEQVGIRIDQTLTQDATGTMAFLEFEAMGVGRVKTELSVSYVDHNMPQNGPNNANDHEYLRTVAAGAGVWFSRPGNGICHQVHLERFGIPGKTLLGSDSHTPTGGGIGMVAIGAGGLDVALAMAGKPFTMTYPKVIGVRLSGRLKPWVAAKDVILHVLSILTTKGNVGCIVEYCGDGVKSLTVPERATITNMGAELGVTCSLFPSDERTKAFMTAQGRGRGWQPCAADPGAEYDRVIEIDLAALEPLVAESPSPDNVRKVTDVAGTPVQQVVIGSCTNSSFRDLSIVAAMLKGRSVNPAVSLGISPGSRQVLQMITESGALATFLAAGARILEAACGPCIGQCFSPAENTVTVRTYNRNFKDRTGTKNDHVFLVSPEVAAATALSGVIADPRSLGIPYPDATEPDRYLIDDSMIVPPVPPGAPAPEIKRATTIGEPPRNTPLPDEINGAVLIKAGDKITTDHIMPAGVFLKHRSNIPEYAKVVFNVFNEPGRPTFAERALAARDAGRHGIIVGGESYGQGSSREHAAICPMYLGVKLVIAKSFERIHAANLVNFGILPLSFAVPADYDELQDGAEIVIKDLRARLASGSAIVAALPTGRTLTLVHALTPRDIEIVLAGGVLNMV